MILDLVFYLGVWWGMAGLLQNKIYPVTVTYTEH
jgi:hypothetical protein